MRTGAFLMIDALGFKGVLDGLLGKTHSDAA
jgi:hypothetical protein